MCEVELYKTKHKNRIYKQKNANIYKKYKLYLSVIKSKQLDVFKEEEYCSYIDWVVLGNEAY